MEGEHQAKNAAVAAVAYCLLKDFWKALTWQHQKVMLAKPSLNNLGPKQSLRRKLQLDSNDSFYPMG